LTVVSHSIAGTTFTATGTHKIPASVMQVLGSSIMAIGATATALARKTGTYGAAIQTLSPGGCPAGSGSKSLTFQGNSTTTVTGDVWSNGVIFDNSNANGGSITGNVVGICPSSPFLTTPSPWTVSGAQANGFEIPDPNYALPPINATSQTWNATSGSVEQAGTYAANPSISGGKPCYFLDAGVYDFTAGFTDNAGFISNELRPPDEPQMAAAGTPNTTTTTANLSGAISSIPVSALIAAVPASATVSVGGQSFTVGNAGAGAGATSIKLAANQSASPAIPSGSLLAVRALPQFWDSNNVNCSGTFTATNPGSSTNNLSGVWSIELTAVRWEPTAGSICSGVATPTCYVRESPPSMCKTISLGPSGNIKVSVSSANAATADPGAQSFNVYLAANGSCSGLAYVTSFSNGSNASTVINNSVFPAGWPTAQPPPPDQEGMPIASGLPNADVSAGTPPHGDLANERQCVSSNGSNASCPTGWTPGAVVFYIPSTGCLDTHGGKADMYLFSGYQYSRVLLYEPGPEQSSSPNNCSNFINGNGFTSLTGIVYVPAASVTVNGNTTYQATIAGGVIAWTAAITGSGGVAIIADPTLHKWPPAVKLIQ
jgi:hypothetical protein